MTPAKASFGYALSLLFGLVGILLMMSSPDWKLACGVMLYLASKDMMQDVNRAVKREIEKLKENQND